MIGSQLNLRSPATRSPAGSASAPRPAARAYRQGMENQLGARSGLNAVLWNSLYMDAAVRELEAGGLTVSPEIRSRLSPLIHDHINFYLDDFEGARLASSGRQVRFDALAEFGRKAADPVGDGVVSFDLAGPAAFNGVLGQLLLAGEPCPQAWGVLAGGEELRAAQVEVAFAGPLGREPQAVAEFEFGLEEVGLEPVQGVLADPAVPAVPRRPGRRSVRRRR